VANGDIIFFIDDDSEVSPDGISALIETFEDKNIFGVGLKLKSKNERKNQSNLKSFFRKLYYIIFRIQHYGHGRIVMLSGYNISPNNDEEHLKRIEWLSGCSMSFRQEIFKNHSFEEKLQKFGGYAFGEDLQFSYCIFKNKMKLVLAKKGYIIHHQSQGGRLNLRNQFAAQIFNQFIIWKTSIYKYKKISIIVYLWSLMGELIDFYLTGFLKKDFNKVKGTSMGLYAIIIDIIENVKN